VEMRGWASFALDVCACSSALPATVDVEASIIRRDSWAGLGFPFLSTKGRSKSILSSFQRLYDQMATVVTCLRSVASIEV
jgi:hypothetical protein